MKYTSQTLRQHKHQHLESQIKSLSWQDLLTSVLSLRIRSLRSICVKLSSAAMVSTCKLVFSEFYSMIIIRLHVIQIESLLASSQTSGMLLQSRRRNFSSNIDLLSWVLGIHDLSQLFWLWSIDIAHLGKSVWVCNVHQHHWSLPTWRMKEEEKERQN